MTTLPPLAERLSRCLKRRPTQQSALARLGRRPTRSFGRLGNKATMNQVPSTRLVTTSMIFFRCASLGRSRGIWSTTLALSLLALRPATAAEPPSCDDPRVLAQVRTAYDSVAESYRLARLLAVAPPQELAVVARPPSLDTPRNRAMLGGYPWSGSRFCQASLKIEGGQGDTVRFRIDGLAKGPEDQYQLTPCFDSVLEREAVPKEEFGHCTGLQ